FQWGRIRRALMGALLAGLNKRREPPGTRRMVSCRTLVMYENSRQGVLWEPPRGRRTEGRRRPVVSGTSLGECEYTRGERERSGPMPASQAEPSKVRSDACYWLGQAIRAVRGLKGVTQEQLVQDLVSSGTQISGTHLSDIENGKCNFSF